MFDYILCVLLVFPALCLYDKWGYQKRSCCVSIGHITKGPNIGHDVKNESFIRRFLSVYYGLIHRFRYPLVGAVIAGTVFCIVVASKLDLPEASDVRLLDKSHELERVHLWKLNLLAADLTRREGSRVYVAWGLRPSDTGNHNDPMASSVLSLDDSFDPAPEECQIHLLNFCDNLFEEEFATELYDDKFCVMKGFDTWLGNQATRASSKAYLASCGGSSSLPVSKDDFHACMLAFTQDEPGSTDVFFLDGKVKIMRLQYRHNDVAYDSGYEAIDSAWRTLTNFINSQNAEAPTGVNVVRCHDIVLRNANNTLTGHCVVAGLLVV